MRVSSVDYGIAQPIAEDRRHESEQSRPVSPLASVVAQPPGCAASCVCPSFLPHGAVPEL